MLLLLIKPRTFFLAALLVLFAVATVVASAAAAPVSRRGELEAELERIKEHLPRISDPELAALVEELAASPRHLTEEQLQTALATIAGFREIIDTELQTSPIPSLDVPAETCPLVASGRTDLPVVYPPAFERPESPPGGATDLRPVDAHVLVFASLSVPRASLAAIFREATKIGAPVVFRGPLEGSFVRTKEILLDLLGDLAISAEIDPLKFKAYRIEAVPAVVVLKDRRLGATVAKCNDNVPLRYYTKIVGDVPLAYALEQIAERDPATAPYLEEPLRLLEGESNG